MALTQRGKLVASGDLVVKPTDGDIQFKKTLAAELVFAWQDSDNPEVRAALERVMGNVGIEQCAGRWEIVLVYGKYDLGSAD